MGLGRKGPRTEATNSIPTEPGRAFSKWGLLRVLDGGVGGGVVKPVGNSSLHFCGKRLMSSAPAICCGAEGGIKFLDPSSFIREARNLD